MKTIFIQIAAYRDRELIPTVQDAIAQAAHPELLSFGICWQYQTEEELQSIEPLKKVKNCRIDAVSAQQSRGACWARSRTQKLWRGERYTLQIDSHIRFASGWDTLLIDMLSMCPSKKAILTAYPPGYEPPRTLLSNIPSRVVPANFDQSGILVLMSEGDLTECSTPQLGAFIAAGFMFADASIIQQVPYDPEIYFYGEEILFSARAWTRGWDIYHPHQAVCWHYYNSTEKQTRPVHWADHQNWWTFNGVSEQRFRQIMKMEPSSKNFGVYGLGKTRTLEEYEALAGVQFRGWKKDRDLELLLYCVRPQTNSIVAEKILTLLQEEINWDSLLQIAANHRVLPLLYWSLKNMHPEVIPQTVLNKLKNYFQSNTVRNLRLTKELFKLLNLLKQHEISAIPFKGPVLAASVYNNLALRIFSDLDIIIKKEDMLKAQKLLLEQGYVIQRQATNQKYLNSKNQDNYLSSRYNYDEWYWKTLDHKTLFGVRVELHWETAFNHIIFPLNSDKLWDNLQSISISDMTFPNLPPEDLLVILCLNYAKDHWKQLKMICDIAEIVHHTHNLNWKQVIEHASSLKRKRILFVGLFLAHDLMGTELPPKIWQQMQTDLVAKALAKQVSQRLFINQGCDPDIVEKILYNLRSREGLLDKVDYLFFSLIKVLEQQKNILFKKILKLTKGNNIFSQKVYNQT